MGKRSVTRFVVVLSAVVLSACGVFRDRSDDYRRAELSKPLDLPPEMQSEALGDEYAVPGIAGHQRLKGEFNAPRPEPLAKNVGQAEVRIQSLDGNRWILLDGAPNQVWPRVRAFLDRVGLEVADINVEQGIIETQWRDAEQVQGQERFRFRLEQGVQVGTSEVHTLVQTGGAGTPWPQRSTDKDRERQVVKVLAQYLANEEAAGTVSILAKRKGRELGKIFLEGEGDQTYIRLKDLPYDRAWAALALALEKSGFEIDEAHQSVNKLWLSYFDPEKNRPGFFRRLFGAERKYIARYVVEMRPVSDNEHLIFLNFQKGRRLPEEKRQDILNRVMGYLH